MLHARTLVGSCFVQSIYVSRTKCGVVDDITTIVSQAPPSTMLNVEACCHPERLMKQGVCR